MEVPVIRMISDLEVSLSTLQNPSTVSIPGIGKINKAYTFMKWGAVYVAFLATLIGVFFTRGRLMIQNYRRGQSPGFATGNSCIEFDDEFSDLDGDEDEDDEDFDADDVSVSSDDMETETRETDEEVKSKLQRRFSWSDFAKGKSVVKLWDGIGLGLDLNQSSGSLISIYDLDREQRISSVFDKRRLSTQSVVRPSPSPSVFVSAERASFAAWDSRVNGNVPSIVAEWNDMRPNSSGAPGLLFRGVKKVWVGDRVSGVVTVADARKVGSLCEVETWWEAE
uniref:Uncharacterized protein n=1 Tax=Kalanchoe fedtschenkoi TaxID=63787 RepID=A0A7N0TKT7_KALFE